MMGNTLHWRKLSAVAGPGGEWHDAEQGVPLQCDDALQWHAWPWQLLLSRSGTLPQRWTPIGRIHRNGEKAVSSTTVKLVVVGGLAIAAAVAYLVLRPAPVATESPTSVVVAPSPPPVNEAVGVIEPTVRFPIPVLEEEPAVAVEESVPAPDLNSSDTVLGEALAGLFGSGGWSELVIVKDLVRRIVVTVDNLPGEQMPWARSPLQRAGGGFQVVGGEDGLRVAPENAARYLPYVQLAEAVNSARLVAMYVRLYPLFQAAYDELGYPSAYFNDRLVVVIDHLLAAPELTEPIRLVQPKVRYHFEDPALQQASAGHKIMLRMGVDNARRIKAKLRDIRQQLTGAVPQN